MKKEGLETSTIDILQEAEKSIRAFITSIKTAEKKPRLGVVEYSVLDICFHSMLDVRLLMWMKRGLDMPKGIKVLFNWVDAITEKTSKPASILVFVMALVTVTEVVGRYVFNHPTIWAWPLNRQIFGIFILVAGAYTMSKGEHIKIEILYDHFPPKIKRIARLLSLACLVSFLGVLVWQSSWMGWNSLMMDEKASGAFRIPLYPFKLLIPVAAFLFLIQGIVVFFRRDAKS